MRAFNKVFMRNNFKLIIRSFSTQSNKAKRCYYDVLDLSTKATSDEIKKQFFKLAKESHPDISKDDSKRFQEIAEAYSILSNEELKTEYDRIKGYNIETKTEEGFSEHKQAQSDRFYHETPKGDPFDEERIKKDVADLQSYFDKKYFKNESKSVKDPLNPLSFNIDLWEDKQIVDKKTNEVS